MSFKTPSLWAWATLAAMLLSACQPAPPKVTVVPYPTATITPPPPVPTVPPGTSIGIPQEALKGVTIQA